MRRRHARAAAAPDVAARAQAARAYSGRLRVKLDGRELRARATVLLAFQRPDALRIEVPGPGGLRLVAVASGERLVAAFPRTGRSTPDRRTPLGWRPCSGSR